MNASKAGAGDLSSAAKARSPTASTAARIQLAGERSGIVERGEQFGQPSRFGLRDDGPRRLGFAMPLALGPDGLQDDQGVGNFVCRGKVSYGNREQDNGNGTDQVHR